MKDHNAPLSPPPAGSGDFFDAESYSDWVRGTMQAMAGRPGAISLFDSTISEPTEQLVSLIHDAVSPRMTSRYVSVFVGGNRFVVDAVCARYGEDPSRLMLTTGVTSAMQMIFRSLVPRGHRVLIERPRFDLLASLAGNAGAVVDDLPRLAPDFRVDLDQLKIRLTPRTRLVVLTNLHNPSGARLAAEDIAAIAALADEVNAMVVVDEIYADFARQPGDAPTASLAPNIISVNSLTKVFGLFALKCGWIAADPAILARIQDCIPEGDVGVSKLSHAVAAHVLEAAPVFDAHWRTIMAQTAPVMRLHAEAMTADGLISGGVPEAGCLYFPRVTGVEDTRALARDLWRDDGVMVAPGEFFGLRGHIRLGFAGEAKTLDRGLSRLHEGLLKRRRR
jgi:aspartate/methionine/tyrosine aminotransferase